jgi:outer membrane protein OmpA-like peptidoglycan-associated protein
MASMLDSLRELASPAILSIVTRQTNESESAVSRAFSAAVPAIAATIANRCDDNSFMKEVADLASRTASDPDPLKSVTRIASQTGTTVDTSTPTGAFLSSLFGHNLAAMSDNLANYAGIRSSSASTILSVAAPLILGYLGRMMRSDNLTTAGLADRLRGMRNQLASAVPIGFEMPEFFHAPFRASRAAVDEVERHPHVAREAESWTAPVLALLGLLGLGGLIWWASHRPVVVEQSRVEMTEPAPTARVPTPVAPAPAPEPPNATGTTGLGQVGTTGMVPSARTTRTLPGNVVINIPTGGTEDRLYNYLSSSGTGGTMIDFDQVKFDSGSAALTSGARDQIDNVAVILRAYPRAAVTIAGYTDNSGSDHANMALSKARADAVAGRLTAKGVQPDRVHAEGFGSQKPVGDNATDAGRADNRRVSIDVR